MRHAPRITSLVDAGDAFEIPQGSQFVLYPDETSYDSVQGHSIVVFVRAWQLAEEPNQDLIDDGVVAAALEAGAAFEVPLEALVSAYLRNRG